VSKVAVECPFPYREVPGSDLGLVIGIPHWGFQCNSLGSPDKFRCSMKWGHNGFHILSDSFFSNHSIIGLYAVEAIDSVFKWTINRRKTNRQTHKKGIPLKILKHDPDFIQLQVKVKFHLDNDDDVDDDEMHSSIYGLHVCFYYVFIIDWKPRFMYFNLRLILSNSAFLLSSFLKHDVGINFCF
jgi:hypothetical protein